MPRPRKHRRLLHGYRETIYKPVGERLNSLNRIIMLPEELEALRLAEIEKLYQEEAAKRMAISRSTFQRILSDAHEKVTRALVERDALEIRMVMPHEVKHRWHCMDCGYRSRLVKVDTDVTVICPECRSSNLVISSRGHRRH